MANYDTQAESGSQENRAWMVAPGSLSITEPDVMNIGGLLQAHNEELLKLRELIGMLDDRIAPVLGPERSEGPSSTAKSDAPDRSEVGRIITDHTDFVHSLQQRVHRMLQRIEL